jgi:hypothetical protein
MDDEYSFEVDVRALVRVQASEPEMAHKVVESVLGAPGSQEIELAKQNNHEVGRKATVTAVDFIQKSSAKLVADNARSVATRRR